MKILISWLGFIGDWLLFIFPLFQGILDVTEGSELLRGAKGTKNTDSKKHRRYGSLLWLLPPLKIMIERRKVMKISKYALNRKIDFDKVYRKLNVATAWVYVSVAGVLNGIVSTEDLLESYGYGDNWWLLIGSCLIIILISIQVIRYFASSDRKKHIFNELS
ncbi:hypothetical protein MOO44_00300 (plasmid) [Nicoliella spurrieriana]|uniref:Uncharacterized protein n=1 Tax=Nicoliella spurrieriana TaxID=2925830 RepID=A0A976RQT3_9LACO|nr:hypothetical protein [Nicoliella spurrieriana]UQS86119.1 hypothetical protein MOO44_00300 [Nicoliella spurrieriana]